MTGLRISGGMILPPKDRLANGQKFTYKGKKYQILGWEADMIEEVYLYNFCQILNDNDFESTATITRQVSYINDLIEKNIIKLYV